MPWLSTAALNLHSRRDAAREGRKREGGQGGKEDRNKRHHLELLLRLVQGFGVKGIFDVQDQLPITQKMASVGKFMEYAVCQLEQQTLIA
jgi:hypothetical protein